MAAEETHQLVGSGFGDHPSSVQPARADPFEKRRDGQSGVEAVMVGHHDGGDAVEAGPSLHLGRCLLVGFYVDLSVGNS